MISRLFRHEGAERGSALLCALLMAAVIAALAGAVVFLAAAENMTSANFRSAHRVMYAADVGIERALGVLRSRADWRSLPETPASGGDLDDGATVVRLSDGSPLDLVQVTLDLQSRTDAVFGALANRPVWRRFVHVPLDRMQPGGAHPEYVAVWVADDPEELDGDPLHDSNDVVLVHAIAVGLHGARRSIDATVHHEHVVDERDVTGVSSGGIRVLAWRIGQ